MLLTEQISNRQQIKQQTTTVVQPESEEIGRSGSTKLKYSYLQRRATKSAISEPRSEGKDNELYQSIKKRKRNGCGTEHGGETGIRNS
jgi:hypothetical protein